MEVRSGNNTRKFLGRTCFTSGGEGGKPAKVVGGELTLGPNLQVPYNNERNPLKIPFLSRKTISREDKITEIFKEIVFDEPNGPDLS